jgi:hypothetical protein
LNTVQSGVEFGQSSPWAYARSPFAPKIRDPRNIGAHLKQPSMLQRICMPPAIIANFNVILGIPGRRDTANDSQFREENDATNVRNR